jgi:hypothetical protein
LGEELASYKTEKPWRERQTIEDESKPAEEKPETQKDEAPATASSRAKPVSL